ncbi:MAG: hypothetical protein ACOCZ6_04045 [Nanoarchaeota archaeon]
MGKIKEIVTNWRIILLISIVLISLILIKPFPIAHDGVAIRHVEDNSSAFLAGMQSPDAQKTKPMYREVITHVDGVGIGNVADYQETIEKIDANDTFRVRTKSAYMGEEESIPRLFFKGDKSYTLQADQDVKPSNQTRPFGLDVYNAPKTNLLKGLDFEGGTRAILAPEEEVTEDEMNLIAENLDERLNIYGLTDVVVRTVRQGLTDARGLVSVEVAGANEQEVKELVGSQGMFEAKIANKTAFTGEDVNYVCRTSECSSAVDPNRPCGQREDGQWTCQYSFSIRISDEGAKKQAELTRELDIVTENDQQYLSKPIKLYMDGKLVDELQISADLQGQETTNIQISGPGTGRTRSEAVEDSRESMQQLQTVLETGSLPVQIEIVSMDTVSPTLGAEFLKNAVIVGFGALIGVIVFIFARYRDIKVALPVAVTMVSEVLIILGIAAAIGWNLDLAAIAGIIIAVGTGIDDQVIIIDETNKKKDVQSWKERVKRAFFIIFAAFFTTFIAMIVLFFSGAGLLRGFALTTILGITAGVLITRPAFALIVEKLTKD